MLTTRPCGWLGGQFPHRPKAGDGAGALTRTPNLRRLARVVDRVVEVKPWLIKTWAVGPGLATSAVLLGLMLAALPAPFALGAAAVTIGALLAVGAGLGEGAAVRVLWAARPLSADERDDLAVVLTLLCRAGLGPPLIDLRVRPGRVVAAVGTGRRSVVLTAELVRAVADHRLPIEQAVAVLAHTATVVRSRQVRSDPVIALASLPWNALRVLARVVSAGSRRLPLVVLAWRARWIVLSVAVAQAASERQVALALTTAVLGVVSYALPPGERRWHEHLYRTGDAGVVKTGYGDALAAFLSRTDRSPAAHARLRTLSATRRPRPALGLVGS